MNQPSRIVVHHSLTHDGVKADFDAIERYHVDVKRWRAIGYQFVVDGKCRCIAGRAMHEVGAHTIGANRSSVGVCIVGNFDVEPPDIELLTFAARHIAGICHALEIEASSDTLLPHNAFADKSCPGRMFSMPMLVSLVQQELLQP